MPSGAYRFRVILHDDCPVYAGHFPGNPIAPGVANIQLVKELAQTLVAQPVRLTSVKQCKFLRPLRPDNSKPVDVMLTLNHGQLSAEIIDTDITVMKIKAAIQ